MKRDLYAELETLVLAIGPEVADEVAAESDPAKIEALITASVERAFSRLSDSRTKPGPRLVVSKLKTVGKASANKKHKPAKPRKVRNYGKRTGAY